jgi:hypothetical protein
MDLFRCGDRQKEQISFEIQNGHGSMIPQTTETKEQNKMRCLFENSNGVFDSERSPRHEIIDQCVSEAWLI